jgi:predicted secreted protein
MKTILFSITLLISTFCLKAQSINAIGSWSVSVPSNTISEAGNDYNINLTSMTNQTILDINVPVTTTSWRVDANKQDSFWNNSLTLWIRKTGDGIGVAGSTIAPLGTIPFFQLANLGQPLFTGTKNYSSIPIQYEIRGLSVLIPASTYNTTVVYTITEY